MWRTLFPIWLAICIVTAQGESTSEPADHQAPRAEVAMFMSHPGEEFAQWRECYDTPASSALSVTSALARLVPTVHHEPGVEVELSAVAQEQIVGARYKMSIWQEATGDKITYTGKGPSSPYSICCSFFLHSNCTIEQRHQYFLQQQQPPGEGEARMAMPTDCPIKEGAHFVGKATRPMFRVDPGVYEVQMELLSDDDEELACVIVPFKFNTYIRGMWSKPETPRAVVLDDLHVKNDGENMRGNNPITPEATADHQDQKAENEGAQDEPLLLLPPPSL